MSFQCSNIWKDWNWVKFLFISMALKYFSSLCLWQESLIARWSTRFLYPQSYAQFIYMYQFDVRHQADMAYFGVACICCWLSWIMLHVVWRGQLMDQVKGSLCSVWHPLSWCLYWFRLLSDVVWYSFVLYRTIKICNRGGKKSTSISLIAFFDTAMACIM